MREKMMFLRGLSLAIIVASMLVLMGFTAQAMEMPKMSKVLREMPSFDFAKPAPYISPYTTQPYESSFVLARNKKTGEIQKFTGLYYYYGWDDDWEVIYRGSMPSWPGSGIGMTPMSTRPLLWL